MKKINRSIYPKTGYQFTESDGTVLQASNWDGVIMRVKRYRRRQRLPEGNAAQEVIEQACRDNPGICFEESPEYKAQLKKTSLKGLVLLWINAVRQRREREPLVFVGDVLHAARVDVCSRCPKNTELPSGCGSCVAALRALAEGVVGNRQLDGRVHGCIVLGEHLPVSTWIETPTLPNPELPAECWRKRTL